MFGILKNFTISTDIETFDIEQNLEIFANMDFNQFIKVYEENSGRTEEENKNGILLLKILCQKISNDEIQTMIN